MPNSALPISPFSVPRHFQELPPRKELVVLASRQRNVTRTVAPGRLVVDMRHREVSGSSTLLRSEYRRNYDRSFVVRRASPARHDDTTRDGSCDLISEIRDDRVSERAGVTAQTEAPHQGSYPDDAPSPVGRHTDSSTTTSTGPRISDQDTANLELVAAAEWDWYWEDLHRRSRIGMRDASRRVSGFLGVHDSRPPVPGLINAWGRRYSDDSREQTSPFELERTRARRGTPSREQFFVFGDRREYDNPIYDDLESSPIVCPKATGVSPRTLSSIPSVLYSDRHTCDANQCAKSANDDSGLGAECAVCLVDFLPNEIVAKLPSCRHLFHRKCVFKWLEGSEECPKCRTVVVGMEEGAEVESEEEDLASEEAQKWSANETFGQGVIFA